MVKHRLWQLNPDTYAITTATAGSTIVIAGDHTSALKAGMLVLVSGAGAGWTGLNGWHTLSIDSTVSTNTTITFTVAYSGTDAALGTLSIYPYITFGETSLAKSIPEWSSGGVKVVPDRWGNTRVIIPPSTYYQRYVTKFSLDVLPEDVKLPAADGRRFDMFLYDLEVLTKHEWLLFKYEDGTDDNGTAYTELFAYKGYMEALPPWVRASHNMVGSGNEGGDGKLSLSFFATGDTLYTDFDHANSVSTWRARP